MIPTPRSIAYRQSAVTPRLRFAGMAPLVCGATLTLLLVLGGIFAPLLTTRDPLQTNTLLKIDGEYMPAPFAPGVAGFLLGSDQLGRDVWSLLLFGARSTLLIALIVAMTRICIGLLIGLTAGWNHDSALDHALIGFVNAWASIPTLLLGVIAILAFDIRTGFYAFTVGLCFTGWSEIAQFARAETIALRERPFIEGARTVGLNGIGIVIRHIMPNILPTLAMMIALEMSAVLLLLGELGFIGVFAGGGIREVQVSPGRTGATSTQTFFSAPEWGALLAAGRGAVFNAAWIIVYPALAFLWAVAGFNLLGEGLRQMLERRDVPLVRVLKWRYAMALAVALLALNFVTSQFGQAAEFARMARAFDEQRTMQTIRTLAAPELKGRKAGSPEYERAAQWVVEQFKAAGLQPGGADSYFQPVPLKWVDLRETPELSLVDANDKTVRAFQWKKDFRVAIGGASGPGTINAPVVFVGWGAAEAVYSDYTLETEGKIVMVLQPDLQNNRVLPQLRRTRSAQEAAIFKKAAALLFIARDDSRLDFKGSYLTNFADKTLPVFTVNRATADAILAGTGHTSAQLYADYDRKAAARLAARQELKQDDSASFETKARAHLSLMLQPIEQRQAPNVIGVLPGTDEQRKDKAVIIGAHLDGIGADPDGVVYPGANDDGWGVAALIEMATLLQKQNVKPLNTIVFIAFTGEESGLLGSDYYVRNAPKFGPRETAAMLQLDGFGAHNPAGIFISEENFALFTRVKTSLERLGVKQVFEPNVRGGSDHQSFLARGAPAVMIAWADPQSNIHLPNDDVNHINLPLLKDAGMVAYLAMLEIAVGK
jgi:peptide/nickel transport system permease protein